MFRARAGHAAETCEMRGENHRTPLKFGSDQVIRKDTALKVRRLNAVAAAGQEQSATFWFLVNSLVERQVHRPGADAVQATAKVVYD